jgi:hypothetical protein
MGDDDVLALGRSPPNCVQEWLDLGPPAGMLALTGRQSQVTAFSARNKASAASSAPRFAHLIL